MRAAVALAAGVAVLALAISAGGTAVSQQRMAEARSGATFLSPAMRARQDDLTVNPGMLWVENGAEVWLRPAGPEGRSCQSCHGAPTSMAGVATRYPAWDAGTGRLLTLGMRIRSCRVDRQHAAPLEPESNDLLSLEALVAFQSRGQAIRPEIDGPARASFDLGRRLYTMRQGQLDISCAQCHDAAWGQRLRTETISQGQATGYPIYRLEWQGAGSLHRRLRSCAQGVRAEPVAYGSDDHVALELYLAWRARGLPLETPAVRR